MDDREMPGFPTPIKEMKIQQLPLDCFLMSDDERGRSPLLVWTAKPWAKQNPDFQGEHLDAYTEAGYAWPPNIELVVSECGPDVMSVSQRAREVVYFFNRKLPMAEHVQ